MGLTVNGVEYPVANVAAGQNEIWRWLIPAEHDVSANRRIANRNTPLPFQLLSKDGVALRQLGPSGNAY